ncbi:unnamed protein product [Phyllotreta striolata]|uniref:RNA helicase n=1 Tax=Phyllotreta striolata TaxID=444603 RepID=A0A9N9XQQ0_PHYSR|nr:unnamed protein product [Phyllotreta striolata]
MLAHRIDDTKTKDVQVMENVTFDSLLLSEKVLKGLQKNGFKKPSPVQLKSIPIGRCGLDLIVKSKSGTGKTLVFSIIALESLKSKKNKLEVLILSPTREIAVQSHDVIKLIGCYFEGLKIETFIGGLSITDDKEKCQQCHIAVGTPGRIKQLIKLKSLITDSVRLFVLDEADKLMEQSFRSDINEIYNSLPSKKQIITTSATYPNDLEEFLSKYMLSPTIINAEIDNPLLLGLKQFVALTKFSPSVPQQMKIKTEELVKIISNVSFTQCLIFSNYQTRAESLSNSLNQKGWACTYVSGAQTQTDRLKAVNELKEFKCRIMLSTDLTARGIDAANVDLVINYDIPVDAMTYLHRMGRAGRYGSTGVCVSIASEGVDVTNLQKILGFIGGDSLSMPVFPAFIGSITDLLNLKIPTDQHIFGVTDKTERKVNPLTKNQDETIENKSSVEVDCDKINEEIDPSLKYNMDVNDVLKFVSDTPAKKTGTKEETSVNTVLTDVEIKEKNLIKNKALFGVSKILHGSCTNDDKQLIEGYFKAQDQEEIDDELSQKDANDLLNILSQRDGYKGPTKSKINEECAVDSPKDCGFDVQNLFKFGYENIVKSSNKNWRECLPDQFTIPLENIEDEFDCDNASEYSEDEDNTSINKTTENIETEHNCLDEEQYGAKKKALQDSNEFENTNTTKKKPRKTRKSTKTSSGNASSEDNDNKKKKSTAQFDQYPERDIMKWIPVESPSVAPSEPYPAQRENESPINNYEQFGSYFEECSNNLWQNGLSFDSAESFDDWYYYEWEAQLYSIRNYVQQNVYVSEMAKFQNCRNQNN